MEQSVALNGTAGVNQFQLAVILKKFEKCIKSAGVVELVIMFISYFPLEVNFSVQRKFLYV